MAPAPAAAPVAAIPRPLFPLVWWDRLPDAEADRLLEVWGHWLGACRRPFGRQSWALWLDEVPVAVAVSASTVTPTCAGYARTEVVELARLCAHPAHRDLTRVALRLWRKTAARAWAGHYWPVRAYVSYSNALRHRGDLYRFDGWRRVRDLNGRLSALYWQQERRWVEPKTLWLYPLAEGGEEVSS